MKPLFYGTCTAMITPFNEKGVDYKAFKMQIEKQLEAGITALLFIGTTGESPTITHSEYKKIVKFAVKTVNKRAKVIVGSGSNNTATAIEKSIYAQKAGADGLLVVTPYYNKCTQNGLIKYYTDIALNVNIPIIAYNVPSRTGVNILPETMAKLTKLPNMVGIKEASGNLEQIKNTLALIDGKCYLYSGDDSLTLEMLKMGAIGSISVCSNPLPKQVEEIYLDFANNNVEQAQTKQNALLDIMGKLFIEVNPIPVKYIMKEMKLDSGIMRAPMTILESKNQDILKQAFIDYGVNL